MSLTTWISLGLGFIALLGVAATYFGYIVKISKELGRLGALLKLETFTEIFNRLREVETKITTHIATVEAVHLMQVPERLIAVETQLHNIDLHGLVVKMDLWWHAVEGSVKELIKQPIHFRKDELIDRFPDLTDDEICELRDILQIEMVELKARKDPKVLAYALMNARIDSVIYDRAKSGRDIKC